MKDTITRQYRMGDWTWFYATPSEDGMTAALRHARWRILLAGKRDSVCEVFDMDDRPLATVTRTKIELH